MLRLYMQWRDLLTSELVKSVLEELLRDATFGSVSQHFFACQRDAGRCLKMLNLSWQFVSLVFCKDLNRIQCFLKIGRKDLILVEPALS